MLRQKLKIYNFTLSKGSNECIQNGKNTQLLSFLGSHSGFCACKIFIASTIIATLAMGVRIPNNTSSPAIDSPRIILKSIINSMRNK